MESVIYRPKSNNSAERLASGVYTVLDIGAGGKLKVSNGSETAIVNKLDFDERLKTGRIKLNCLVVQCVEKQRDKHNNIKAYLLQDKNGNKKVFNPAELKQAIANYQIQVLNLTLTSDNRLIDTAPPKQTTEKKQVQVDNVQKTSNLNVAKKPVKLVDYILTKEVFNAIIKHANNKYYEILTIYGKSKSDKLVNFANSHSSAVEDIEGTELSVVTKEGTALVFCKNPEYNLKMPVSCKELLKSQWIYPYELNLNGIDWSDTETVESMFSYTSNLEVISIANSEAPKLKNMYAMFKGSDILNVNFSTFNVPNLDRATSMFHNCYSLDKLDISGLNFSKVRFVGMMFFMKIGIWDDDIDVSDFISMCKHQGWKGYADGRPDDFDKPFSKPIKHYEDEKPKKKKRRVKLRPLNKYANTAIKDLFG